MKTEIPPPLQAALLTLLLTLAGCQQGMDDPEHWPWTPEVQEFVDIYMEHGGQREIDWVGDDVTLSPDASLSHFETLEGIQMELVASEPVIRQPVEIHFDERGRLWVVQYLQYPFPAGVTINFYDQYLRAEFDGVPPPPPDHVRGADKITLLEDTNGDGRFDTHRDVITGLNITTSVLFAYGGLWVVNPPYLLFYPDHDGDGIPDGDPEVRLEGFGLEDTHSLANGLKAGPDGWIYGVHGSTSTAEVRDLSFLGQAVWRYHPKTDRFELFSEGGGNPWALDMDRKGRAFSGTNAGGTRGLHQVQGGRYLKSWAKHGPFTRPWSYGYLNAMEHDGYAQRFAMTYVIYEEGRLPGYEGQQISGMALTNRIQASRFIKDGSTFRTEDTDSLVTTTDRGFRPVDMKTGPDGAVYIADWCDIRMNHVHPVDTWNKSCGRIWRLQSDDYRPVEPFNLAELGSDELVDLLMDERKWYREHARRLLGERGAEEVLPRLMQMVRSPEGQPALEALWAIHLIEGVDSELALELLDHPDPHVRAWTVRLTGDQNEVSPELRDRLVRLAIEEPDAEVRSQLAASARRLPTADALPILTGLLTHEEDLDDKQIPLLIWWGVEELVSRDGDAVLDHLEEADIWESSLFVGHTLHRLAQRFASERGDSPAFSRLNPYENWIEYAYHPRRRLPDGKGDYTEWETNHTPDVSDLNLNRLARLLSLTNETAHLERMLEGVVDGFMQGELPATVPTALTERIDVLWSELGGSATLAQVTRLTGHPEAVELTSGLTGGDVPVVTGQSEQVELMRRGEQVYLTHCAPCHQVDGSGMEGMAAPLRTSAWTTGASDGMIRILLHGLSGRMQMPPMASLSDQELAEVISYIRDRWGDTDTRRVTPDEVGAVRKATSGRTQPWTVEELRRIDAEGLHGNPETAPH